MWTCGMTKSTSSVAVLPLKRRMVFVEFEQIDWKQQNAGHAGEMSRFVSTLLPVQFPHTVSMTDEWTKLWRSST